MAMAMRERGTQEQVRVIEPGSVCSLFPGMLTMLLPTMPPSSLPGRLTSYLLARVGRAQHMIKCGTMKENYTTFSTQFLP